MKKIFLFMLCVAVCLCAAGADNVSAPKASLSGVVRDAADQGALIGVIVSIPELSVMTTTDADGRYRIDNLPMREITVQVSYLGHQNITRKVDLQKTQVADFLMKEANVVLGDVVVTGVAGQTLRKDSPVPEVVMSPAELRGLSSTNIIDALAHLPGVSQVTTGSGISKPVIRGLGYNRVVTIDDGVRQEGQQWGDEHGIEVDAQSVASAEVLKGPATLMYGSDAMAGVVILHGAPMMAQGDMRGDVSAEYQTNNGLADYSLHFAGNQHGFVWDTRYSGKLAHAYKNPVDGYVLGSQFREQAFSTMLGSGGSWGFSHLKLGAYHLTPSMTEGERDEATGGFLKTVLSNGVAEDVLASHHDLTTYGRSVPYQQVYHYKAVLDNLFFVGPGSLKLILAYQQNQRKEFEDVAEPNTPGLSFRLHTLSYDARYLLRDRGAWSLASGVNGMFQRSENLGTEYLIPEYRLFDFGVFATSDFKMGNWSLSGGLRFDHRSLDGFALKDYFNAFTRHFNALTGSVGGVYTLGQQHFRVNLSRGYRAPNLSELSANGEHEGTFRYELGDNQLKAEHSWQVDAGWDVTSRKVKAELSLFANFIDNYIYTRRTDRRVEQLPVYQYAQGNARLLGGELSVDVHPVERLHIANSFSYVDAVQLHQPRSTKYLPMTPAPRWNLDVRYDVIRDGRLFNNLYVRAGSECYLRQNHYYSDNHTETATPGYMLLSASAGTDIRLHGRRLLTLSLIGTNLANRAYQSHLSRLKYADRNEVTGREGIYNMGRNVTLKLTVPIAF